MIELFFLPKWASIMYEKKVVAIYYYNTKFLFDWSFDIGERYELFSCRPWQKWNECYEVFAWTKS